MNAQNNVVKKIGFARVIGGDGNSPRLVIPKRLFEGSTPDTFLIRAKGLGFLNYRNHSRNRYATITLPETAKHRLNARGGEMLAIELNGRTIYIDNLRSVEAVECLTKIVTSGVYKTEYRFRIPKDISLGLNLNHGNMFVIKLENSGKEFTGYVVKYGKGTLIRFLKRESGDLEDLVNQPISMVIDNVNGRINLGD